MIIDAHTHIFPEKSAENILRITSKKFKVKVYGKGTASDLIVQMNENGINYAVIHMVAVNPKAASMINTWLINLSEPRFIKFGTIHPHQQNYQQEIARLKEHGIRGVKLQPDVQGFTVNNKELTYPLYEELANKGLTVMFHVGGNPIPRSNQRSTPQMVLKVAQQFRGVDICVTCNSIFYRYVPPSTTAYPYRRFTY